MDFENIGLKIGDVLQIELCNQPGSRYPVRLIGLNPNHGFIITSPKNAEGNLMFLKEGQEIIVRFAALNSVIAFNTQVLEDRTRPYPHVHIAIPPKIESVEVRKAIRVQLALVATVINETGESSPVTMRITDLSFMGAKLEGQVEVGQKGDTLSVTMVLKVDEYEYTVTVMGNIVASGINFVKNPETDEEEAEGLFFGIKFAEIDAEDAAPLHAFVYREMLKQFHAL
ncbi:MAG TPA: flagellar brake protein [Aeromonadales bacterium]|nr:flagellar brake protein [Aeromonadales bacterium]